VPRQAVVCRLDANEHYPMPVPATPKAVLGRAVAIGNFDGVHLGHQAIVADLAQHTNLLPTVLTFEPHPRTYFAKQGQTTPVQNILGLRDRVKGLLDAGAAQVIVGRFNRAMAQMPALEFIERLLVGRLKAKNILVGEDFRFGAQRQGDFDLLQAHAARLGYEVARWPQVQVDERRVSSSWVRQAIEQNDLALVQRLLGRPLAFSGHVIHGQKLGRTLGFPTLNLKVPAFSALKGVLVVRVHGLGPKPLPAVASLGSRPAVASDGRLLLESFVLDWSGDAYGRCITVECLHKLRDEAHYNGLQALQDQIARDTDQARQWWQQFLSKESQHG
jgi:riboflavin kinase / FMN adenylyltransferase